MPMPVSPEDLKTVFGGIFLAGASFVSWWQGRKARKKIDEKIETVVGTANGGGTVIQMNERQLENQEQQLTALGKANDAIIDWQGTVLRRLQNQDDRQERTEVKVDKLVDGLGTLTSEIRSQRHVALDVSKFQRPTERTIE